MDFGSQSVLVMRRTLSCETNLGYKQLLNTRVRLANLESCEIYEEIAGFWDMQSFMQQEQLQQFTKDDTLLTCYGVAWLWCRVTSKVRLGSTHGRCAAVCSEIN